MGKETVFRWEEGELNGKSAPFWADWESYLVLGTEEEGSSPFVLNKRPGQEGPPKSGSKQLLREEGGIGRAKEGKYGSGQR